MGIAASANAAVLQSARRRLFEGNALDWREIARDALVEERLAAGGRRIAAQDVLPIVVGGQPFLVNSRADDEIVLKPVAHESEWIEDHFLIAYQQNGTRHKAVDVLARLLTNPNAKSFVQAVSELALRAAEALTACDAGRLAELMATYVMEFDRWLLAPNGSSIVLSYVNPSVSEFITSLRHALGNDLLGFKPPGAGAASSCLLLLADAKAKSQANAALAKLGWTTMPVVIADGLQFRFHSHSVVFSAPGRIDLIGAGDLSVEFAMDGFCLSLPIGPSSTGHIRFSDDAIRPNFTYEVPVADESGEFRLPAPIPA